MPTASGRGHRERRRRRGSPPGVHRAPDTVADEPQRHAASLRRTIWRSGSVFGKHGGRDALAARRLASLSLSPRRACAACHHDAQPRPDADGGPARRGRAIAAPPLRLPTTRRKLGITAMQVWVHESPRAAARASSATCASARPSRAATSPPGPTAAPAAGTRSTRAATCASATRPRSTPRRRSCAPRARGPTCRKPLPYHYGFVRAVAPQYLKVPEQGGAARERVRAREAPGVVDQGRR